MTKRVKRSKAYELQLEIKDDRFIATPRASQRNWLLNRVVWEVADELAHLDSVSGRMVPGADGSVTLQQREQAALADEEIMEDWQIPIMAAMSSIVTEAHGDVLEVGFGRGVASDLIQAGGVRSHTVIECNDTVVARYRAWLERYPGSDIRLAYGRWQDVISELGNFDGIFFHTYPLDEMEFVETVVKSSTFAEHFFSVAHDHLVEGGVFTYLTNEAGSLGRSHQRALLRYFRSFTVSVVSGLDIPPDTRDAAWLDSMVVVRAVR